jgi:putative PIN family toxin of toxin-antitoxin system
MSLVKYPKLAPAFPDPAAIVNLIREMAIVVEPKRPLAVLEDDADNSVLEAASEARADAIVTGDHRILDLRPVFREVRLLRPREFLVLLEGDAPTFQR